MEEKNEGYKKGVWENNPVIFYHDVVMRSGLYPGHDRDFAVVF